jgi:hypothetical protein
VSDIPACTDCGEPCIDAGPGLGWQCVSESCRKKAFQYAMESIRYEHNDAKRYRWLREMHPIHKEARGSALIRMGHRGAFSYEIPHGTELDEKIDAAIAKAIG